MGLTFSLASPTQWSSGYATMPTPIRILARTKARLAKRNERHRLPDDQGKVSSRKLFIQSPSLFLQFYHHQVSTLLPGGGQLLSADMKLIQSPRINQHINLFPGIII